MEILLSLLGGIAVLLTCTMVISKSSMLGFPSAVFWMLFGGQAYTLSTAVGDIYFLTAIASLLGMTFFCMFGAYALRTKKEEAKEGDQLIDEGGDKDIRFIDEGGNTDNLNDDEESSNRVKALRDRADKRRRR